MARAIDADEYERELLYDMALHGEQLSGDVAYNRALVILTQMPTLTPPNEPLSLEQLREMDEPVWVACKPIEGGNGYWCVCQHGRIITPAGNIYDVKEIPHWVFYRRPLEEGKGA